MIFGLIQVRKTDSESDTSSVVHESESYEKVRFFATFCTVPHGVAHPRSAFLGVSEVNADFNGEINVLECF